MPTWRTAAINRVACGQHAALIGGPNAVNCPLCHKMYLGGAALMEHMKHVHKDPNASGVAGELRSSVSSESAVPTGSITS